MSGERAGLYVHVPFCARACPYCDFDFEVAGPRLPDAIARWREGLARELEARAAEFEPASFDSLYLGGGTPSALGGPALAELIAWLRTRVVLDACRELSVELNPEHVDAELLAALRSAAVDRVSLGVQTLAARGLVQLGRVHGGAQARAAVAACVAAGLRTSVDLIVGWPGQSQRELDLDLDALLELDVEHVSIYALTIEPETAWPTLVRRGLRSEPDEDQQASLLAHAHARLSERGLLHYEVASHARPGREAWHNGKYWRGVDVLALGPSAASVRVHPAGPQGPARVERRRNRRTLARWLADPLTSEEPLDVLIGAAAAGEALWLALRRLDGLAVEPWLTRWGVDRAWLDRRIARQLALGNLAWTGEILHVAPGRWLWHDAIATDLLDDHDA